LWKIGDFGFTAECSSKFRDQSSKDGRGTEGYRAPELRIKDPRYSTKTDVWSLGCVLYELAFGKQAFLDDWNVREYVQSKELDLPFDSLSNWDDFSKDMLKTTLLNTLNTYHFIRVSAEQFQDMMGKFIELGGEREPGMGERGARRIGVGERPDVDTTDTLPFDTETDEASTDDDPIHLEPKVSKSSKQIKKGTAVKGSINAVNDGRIGKVREIQMIGCEICGKKFKRKLDLKRHETIHTNERNYPCPHYPLHRAFSRKDALKVCNNSK